MHDGYIYTLGICGSAAGGGPAPVCLDLMLAALPPVKRAAYLGEVLLSADAPSLDDPLIAPVRDELADTELVLLVTPLPGGALPASLSALAAAIEHMPPPPARRFAVLVAFADGSLAGLWPLRHALDAAGIEILSELYAPTGTLAAAIAEEAVTLARIAYARARALHPEALP
jgi:hypothetical protein